MDATLILPAGEIMGCDIIPLAVGEGVLSVGEVWKPECIGLKPPGPKPEAADVSGITLVSATALLRLILSTRRN